MLRGSFVGGRPYVEGRLIVPRLGIADRLPFLVDTGAHRTILMPTDVRNMGMDYGQLTGHRRSLGVAGALDCFVEEAYLVFTEPGRFDHLYRMDLLIAPEREGLLAFPSILGRDILHRWRMTYDFSDDTPAFEVRAADHTQAI